jgi:hypothetical protein
VSTFRRHINQTVLVLEFLLPFYKKEKKRKKKKIPANQK